MYTACFLRVNIRIEKVKKDRGINKMHRPYVQSSLLSVEDLALLRIFSHKENTSYYDKSNISEQKKAVHVVVKLVLYDQLVSSLAPTAAIVCYITNK